MLEIQQLGACYGDSLILQGVTLRVAAGQGVALVGRNGAGKTTLLSSIVGGAPKVSGTVHFDGQDITAWPTHRRVRQGLAMVPEDRRIFSHLSVEENLILARHGQRSGTPALTPDAVCALFPLLSDLRSRMGGQLSGGQQQVLALARGFVARPRCMLLDEPTEGVAPLIVEQMALQINAARQAHQVGMLLAEQNLWFARRCTSYLYVIETGRIVFEGDWPSFDARPDVATRHLGV